MLYSTYFGVDSHARTTTVCALDPETGSVSARRFDGNPYGEICAWMRSFPQPSLAVYESGCTGFEPARQLSGGQARCAPLAVSTIPRAADASAKKSDRRDAERLARAAAAGEGSEVWVPPADVEGLRDLASALADLRADLAAVRQRISALLLRHGLVWSERTASGRPRAAWGKAHRAWLESASLPDPASRAALKAYLDAEASASGAAASLEAEARELALASRLSAQVLALQAVTGCGFRLALAFCAEVGDFERFGGGRRVSSYFGLAPGESSSGGRVRAGRVTRGGNRGVRTLLVEAAWTYGRPGRPGRKRAAEGVPPAVAAEARAASAWLARRRASLAGGGVQACKANSATARELAAQLWAVGLAAQRAAPAAAGGE